MDALCPAGETDMMASLLQEGGSDCAAEDEASRWLHAMAGFCEELQEFLAAVPADASLASCTAMDGDTARQYPRLAHACSHLAQQQYMHSIDYATHAKQIEAVYKMGVQACRMLNAHPALGVFQGIPETRVELFFDRQLNACMALGVEHGLSMQNARLQQLLDREDDTK